MNINLVGYKSGRVRTPVYNADTIVLPPGAPVFMNIVTGGISLQSNGAVSVVGAVNFGTNFTWSLADFFCMGIVCNPGLQPSTSSVGLQVSGIGETLVWGYTTDLILTTQTRASSTASWSTAQTIGSGVFLVPESSAGYWMSLAAQSFGVGVGSTGTAAAALSGFIPFCILGQSLASSAGSASTTADSRTAITTSAAGFVRFL
jgi:hypothetical protein